jgi:lipid II:glycine glycyltransferase (peptidoglycan interpeptide bridge formation enzyme)
MECGRQRHWRCLECRGGNEAWEGSKPSLAFYGHRLDLEPGAERVFGGFSGALRRGIRKAQAAGLRVEFGAGLDSVEVFYDLHCRTRRRHGLPPQPFCFFANIQRHLLERGGGFVAIVRLDNQPAGAAVFFCQGRNALYKFGASAPAFLQWRPNNLVMWESIKQCMALGCKQLHFGRTSIGNEGLRRFKIGFGAREEQIRYAKYDFKAGGFVTDKDRVEGWFNRVFGYMPLSWLRLAGKVLYPHLT